MKKIYPLVFLSILLLQFTNCKSEGKGRLIITLAAQQLKFDNYASDPPIDAEMEKKITGIIKKRLDGIGIDTEDIAFSNKGNRLELTISGISNYPPDIKRKIREVIFQNGKVELWETYTIAEIAPALNTALTKLDSANGGRRLMNLMSINPEYQQGTFCNLGSARPADTMKVNQFMDSLLSTGSFPANFRYRWTVERKQNDQMVCELILLKADRNGEARMSNPKIDKAELKTVEGDRDELYFMMSGFDADAWKRMTRDNVHRSIAIAVDGVVYTWPSVVGQIDGGVFSITGLYESEEFKKLEAVVNTEPLPVPVNIISEELKD